MFTARYGLSPYIAQINLVLKGLKRLMRNCKIFKGENLNKSHVITVSILTCIKFLCHSVCIFPSKACTYMFSIERAANILNIMD